MQIKFRHGGTATKAGWAAVALRVEGQPNPLFCDAFLMADVHHETVLFTGRVQGVGFRYTALQIAKEYEVSGYVKNLADGRVQIEVEGAPDEVSAFVGALEERMHGYVRKTERETGRREPQFTGFAIK